MRPGADMTAMLGHHVRPLPFGGAVHSGDETVEHHLILLSVRESRTASRLEAEARSGDDIRLLRRRGLVQLTQ